jgi:hypothetical protein
LGPAFLSRFVKRAFALSSGAPTELSLPAHHLFSVE